MKSIPTLKAENATRAQRLTEAANPFAALTPEQLVALREKAAEAYDAGCNCDDYDHAYGSSWDLTNTICDILDGRAGEVIP